MNEHSFQAWVEKTANYSGILACGVRLANQSVTIKTFDESFPEAHLKELLQCLTQVAFTLRNSQFGASRFRWVFQHGQLQSARRMDGALAVLVMSMDPGPASAIEELFAEFLDMACPASERSSFILPEGMEPRPRRTPAVSNNGLQSA